MMTDESMLQSSTPDLDRRPYLTCGFCESDRLDVVAEQDCAGDVHFFVQCLECAATGPICNTYHRAIDGWNTNHPRRIIKPETDHANGLPIR